MEDVKLGESLLKAGVVNAAQLKQAVDLQKSLGGDLKEILVKLGFVKEDVLSNYVAQQQNMNAVDPLQSEVDTDAVSEIPRAVMEKYDVIPLKAESGKILLAMSDPNNYRAIEEIQFLTNRRVETAVASKNAIRKALNRLFSSEGGAAPAQPVGEDVTELLKLPFEQLFRAYLLTQLEQGKLDPRILKKNAERFGA